MRLIAIRTKNDIPEKELSLALVVGEDHRFFLHFGADPVAIVRAIVMTLLGRHQGGSTIEQQLVRTVTGNYRRNIQRKVGEILLASTVSKTLDKHEVISAYLSIAYFGTDALGIHKAKTRPNFLDNSNANNIYLIIAALKYPLSKESPNRNKKVRENRAAYLRARTEKLHLHSAWSAITERENLGASGRSVTSKGGKIIN